MVPLLTLNQIVTQLVLEETCLGFLCFQHGDRVMVVSNVHSNPIVAAATLVPKVGSDSFNERCYYKKPDHHILEC